jgi:putative NADH-flavin reductase
MKIAITGHTNGIGKALYAELSKRDHEVFGYSRSNNYDISDCNVRNTILEEIKEFDVFINNAYSPNAQYHLLEQSIHQWEGQRKLIINMGSKSIYAEIVPDFMKSYITDKKKQHELLQQRKLKAKPQTLNLTLGLTNTQMSDMLDADKLDTVHVAELLANLIELKDRIYVQELMIDVPFQNWDNIRPKNL